MSRQHVAPLAKKAPGPWERLRPVKQDVLETMGYVSKGDNRLLDVKTQESFYQKITARYMRFCTHHKRDLDSAFAALSLGNDATAASSDPTRNPPVATTISSQIQNNTSIRSQDFSTSKWASKPSNSSSSVGTSTTDDLSIILTALRKLREGLLATSSTAVTPVFSQRVHIFNIRVAILALHPPSYHPSLSYLLGVLHTKDHPLPDPELKEMTTYMILDLALRQKDLIAATSLKHDSRVLQQYHNSYVDIILRSVVDGNWVAFWRLRRQVDGYLRAMMHWHIETVRKSTLKTFGRAYLRVDTPWLLESASGNEMSWDELKTKEVIGWSKDGENVVIRKPKIKS